MKINNFEGLAELLFATKKDKVQQAISIQHVADGSVDLSSKERKALHKEELRKAKAEYKKSCQRAKESTEENAHEKTVKVEIDNALKNVRIQKAESIRPAIRKRKTISEAEIDTELANLIHTAESIDQFKTVSRKFRETLEDTDIISYYDLVYQKAIEEYLASMTPKKEHKKHKINKKKGVAIFCNGMTNKERHKLNGDKSAKGGYSSTGVKLPTKLELEQYHDKREEERERHAKFIRENPDRKRHGKMIIYIASGGQNKQY